MQTRNRRTVAAATTLLVIGLLAPVATATSAAAATTDDLLISEYVEGSSYNKAIEIYNGTDASIDLSAYALAQYSNGSTTPTFSIPLSGTLPAGEVHVLAHSSSDAAILAVADQTSGAGLFNGDDALVLTRGNTVVDSLGQVGTDPGTEWGIGLVSTADNTLRRLPTVCTGDTNTADAFDPAAEWEGFATDTFDGLGTHTVTECTPGGGGGTDPGPEPEPQLVPIGAVQGDGDTTPLDRQPVTVEAVVTGDFQTGGFDGFFVQDAGDDDPATSDGIFVYAPGAVDVAVGDVVRVTGTAGEYYGSTQLSGEVEIEVLGTADVPEPLELSVPIGDEERYEGMLVTFPQELTILEYYNFGRYGEIALGTERQYQPTAVHEPGSPEAAALAAANAENRITLDDGRSVQNPDPARHPNGEEFTLDNLFRGGDVLTDVTGILDYRYNLWRIQPTQPAGYEARNPRPDVPEVGGTLQIASYNVLNYFTTLGSRGADTAEELERQQAKIVAALAEMDADVYGLVEIENNGTAVLDLVDALNEHIGTDGYYAAVETGVLGDDEITNALIYQPATVTPVGEFAALDYADGRNRPTLLQTFQENATGALVDVAVNHLKSKGSACEEAPDTGDGQGNCAGVRTAAAQQMVDWIAGDPTGSGSPNDLVIGDLNAYDHEDAVDVFIDAGYTDLVKAFGGEYAYSYVFDGQLGYLDHALASAALTEQVTGAAAWHVNADEVSLIDYDMTYKKDAQDALWAPDPYRSSDHDPILVGVGLHVPDTTAPELAVSVSPERIWPPNNTLVPVSVSVEASDDSGEVTVELTDVTATSPKASWTSPKASWVVVDDTEVLVRAVKGTRYTLTYTATDAAGNATVESVTVAVGTNQGWDRKGFTPGR
ncbi:ExeM/NucH family extracellular endonuclease [Quadrisphaera sp. GCM10027208]|uniref:ExeM/NucH family extracellular endonuclease n=1 Tax=Quadrisphaera sp. GCM10027208 TaxID=3273423 RepID=UPI00360AB239